MMHDNIIFWVLMCSHLLGDFYFQPQKLVVGKNNNMLLLLKHSVIYAMAVIVLILPYYNLQVILAIAVLTVSHLVVDYFKIIIIRHLNKESFAYKNAFCIDQIIHIAIIILIAYIYAINNAIVLNNIGNMLLNIYYNLQINLTPEMFIRLAFAFLLIGKPANIFIKEINQKDNILPSSNQSIPIIENRQSKPEYQNAGRLIGILERIIIVVMIILNQYAAIGLVFTAKSIARYDEITKNPSFAEYYLVGTLLSVIIAVSAVLAIQP